MDEADETGDPLIEEGGLHLYAEECRIVRIESRIQVAFYGGEIDAVIFDARVIAHHGDRKDREAEQQNDTAII